MYNRYMRILNDVFILRVHAHVLLAVFGSKLSAYVMVSVNVRVCRWTVGERAHGQQLCDLNVDSPYRNV